MKSKYILKSGREQLCVALLLGGAILAGTVGAAVAAESSYDFRKRLEIVRLRSLSAVRLRTGTGMRWPVQYVCRTAATGTTAWPQT